jgi:hypothetical protein
MAEGMDSSSIWMESGRFGRRLWVSHNAVTWNRAAASLSRRRLPDLPSRRLDSPHSATWSDLRPRPLQDNCFCLAWFSCYCIFSSCLLSCRCVHGCFLASLPWSEIPAWHLQANIQFITHQLVVMQTTAEAEAGVVSLSRTIICEWKISPTSNKFTFSHRYLKFGHRPQGPDRQQVI